MKKEIRKVILIIPSQEALLNSPISPMLGQFGVKVKPFCDEFNKKTLNLKKGLLINTYITIYEDLSFDIEIGEPPISFLLSKMVLNKNISNKKEFLLNIFYILNIFTHYNKIDMEKNVESILRNFNSTFKSMNAKLNFNK